MKNRETIVPRLTRRGFIRAGAATAFCYDLLPMMRPRNVRASEKLSPRGSADYCIFIFLDGGPSQIDTFDLKEGRYTPQDFDVRTFAGGTLKLPYAIFPRLSEKLDDLAIVRSVEAWEAGHSRAQYYLQVAHPVSPARRSEMPSLGAVIAYEMESRRKPTDFLPPYVAMNYNITSGAGIVGAGCLHPKYNPLAFNTQDTLDLVVRDADRPRFLRRWKLLSQLERESGSTQGAGVRQIEEYESHYSGAHAIMLSPKSARILQLKQEERKRYGASALGDACLLGRNLIAAEAGTRYVFITHDGWDLHAKAYDKTSPRNQYSLGRELDDALSSLLTDLSQQTTKEGDRLLDKTLIVCMGEFGRTVGDLTVNKGRDHHRFASTSLFAGGGVKGGRIIGATDPTGAKVVDPGWNKKRSIYIEDIAATMYSAFGIDWSKKITTTPSGRDFEYIENVSGTTFLDVGEIQPLFT
jgi:hypothetical protein